MIALVLGIGCVVCIASPVTQAASRNMAHYEKVEKGFELGTLLGFSYDFSSPVTELESGLVTGIELGYDLTWVLRLKLGFCNHLFSARVKNQVGELLNADYQASVFFGGASIAILATQRFYLSVQASLGYLFTHPKKIDQINASGSNDVAISLGAGIEYYTILRHFSVGFETNLTVLPIRNNVMLAVYPVLRYTFGGGEVRVVQSTQDRDNDGIADSEDKCPDTWGSEDQKGCPTPETKTKAESDPTLPASTKTELNVSKSTRNEKTFGEESKTPTHLDQIEEQTPTNPTPDIDQAPADEEPRADDETPVNTQTGRKETAKTNTQISTDSDWEDVLEAVQNEETPPTSAETSDRETIAYAGPDRTVLVGEPVTLDGSGSVTKLGEPLRYKWTLSGKPLGSKAQLSDTTAIKPVFTPDKAGKYEFVLETSVATSRHSDSVTITAE